jgi:hypothetical protein
MSRIKIAEVQNLLDNTISAKWVSYFYVIQYPYEPQLNFIAFSYEEFGKEIKKVQGSTQPIVYEITTFGTPKIKKLSEKIVKQTYLKY